MVRLCLCLLLFDVTVASAQEPLIAGQTATGELVVGGTAKQHVIELKSADFATLTLTQHRRVDVVVYAPDGSLLRRFPAPAADGQRQFTFVAEATGGYRLELTSAAQGATYEVTLQRILGVANRLRQTSGLERYQSPRLQALRDQISAGRLDTASFWADVATKGTPIVEPFDSDPKYQLVTFLWRNTPETRNVYVYGSMHFAQLGPADYLMHRLDQSDIWYLTLKIPAGARFSYRLSPNDPLTWEGPRVSERDVTSQADPLNKRVWGCRPNSSKYACSSAVELPGAVPQPWVNKTVGTPAGTIERRTFKSIILGMERPIAVYTPPGDHPDATPTPLVVLFDGESYLSEAQAVPTTMDNLIAASRIPPTTVVFVLNTGNGGQRLADLLDNERFGDFVAKELVPWMRMNYNVTSDVARTVAGGFSAGGIAAAFVALKHSDVVGNVMSQSGAFWWEQRMRLDGPDDPDFDDVPEANTIATLYAQSRKLSLRFYLDAGTLEIDPGPFGILTQNRHFRDVLLAKGYTVYFQQFVGGHDGLSWRGTVADGLIALLAEH